MATITSRRVADQGELHMLSRRRYSLTEPSIASGTIGVRQNKSREIRGFLVGLKVCQISGQPAYQNFHHFFSDCCSGGEPSSVVTGTPAAGSK